MDAINLSLLPSPAAPIPSGQPPVPASSVFAGLIAQLVTAQAPKVDAGESLVQPAPDLDSPSDTTSADASTKAADSLIADFGRPDAATNVVQPPRFPTLFGLETVEAGSDSPPSQTSLTEPALTSNEPKRDPFTDPLPQDIEETADPILTSPLLSPGPNGNAAQEVGTQHAETEQPTASGPRVSLEEIGAEHSQVSTDSELNATAAASQAQTPANTKLPSSEAISQLVMRAATTIEARGSDIPTPDETNRSDPSIQSEQVLDRITPTRPAAPPVNENVIAALAAAKPPANDARPVQLAKPSSSNTGGAETNLAARYAVQHSAPPAPSETAVPSAPPAIEPQPALAPPTPPSPASPLPTLETSTAPTSPELSAAAVQPSAGGSDVPVKIAPPARGPEATPLENLALHIAGRSARGESRFVIRLDPPELGRIDVNLSVNSQGHAQAVLTVEKPQTLEMLQRDASGLERSLKDAGVDLGGNLSFSLKGEGRQTFAREDGSPRPSPTLEIAAAEGVKAHSTVNSTLLDQLYGGRTARLDIVV